MRAKPKSELVWRDGGARGMSEREVIWHEHEYLIACKESITLRGDRREWWTYEVVFPDVDSGTVAFYSPHTGDLAHWSWQEVVWFADLDEIGGDHGQ